MQSFNTVFSIDFDFDFFFDVGTDVHDDDQEVWPEWLMNIFSLWEIKKNSLNHRLLLLLFRVKKKICFWLFWFFFLLNEWKIIQKKKSKHLTNTLTCWLDKLMMNAPARAHIHIIHVEKNASIQ